MKLDIEVRAFPVDSDENLKAALDKCAAEGFVPLAGIPPVIVYYLVHAVAQATAGVGTMQIDDSKVEIIRAGDKKH